MIDESLSADGSYTAGGPKQAAMSSVSEQAWLHSHLHEASSIMRTGVVVLLLGLLPLGAWMAFAPLSSAVVAPAYVKVDLNRRPVQHAEGGIVREVFVRDGQRVRQGEPLLALGDVAVEAEVNRLNYRVHAERASLARLEAEQSMATEPVFPAELMTAAREDVRLSELFMKERMLFKARRNALVAQLELLGLQRERIAQEIAALNAQIAQAELSLRHQRADLQRNRALLNDGFISPGRISQIEAGVADYAVKLEEKRSDLARAEQRMLDMDLKLGLLDSEYRAQASDQIKVTTARLSEIEQELRKSIDASARQVIVAPASGEVIGLKYSSAGAVVSPREAIAEIVPSDTRLVIEARIRPEDVNRVHTQQPAQIRFTAFERANVPLVDGEVLYVSADRLVDQPSQVAYYTVLVEANGASLAQAGNIQLQAGMPAEVYIRGEERTPLQYLVQPLTRGLRRAAREG